MKLFERTAGYYLFWTGFVYFCVGMYAAFIDKFAPVELIQAVWILVLCLPFLCPPLGRWLNMKVDWDIKMFDWFKSRDERKAEYDNVLKFPELKAVPELTLPAPKEEPAKIYYRFGVTDNNRVAFSMGYSEITLNKEGCQQMIDQIEFFMNQIKDEQ